MRKFGGLAQIASLFGVVAVLLAACSGPTNNGATGIPTAAASVMKVALVTDGGLNDNGFNHLASLGYAKAQKYYGFPSEIIQTQSPTDDVARLTQAAQAADLVIAVGLPMQAPLDQVAKGFPSKKFAIVDGCATLTNGNCDPLPNVASLYFKEQEAGCLVGAMAAQMELDGKAKVPHLLGAQAIGAVGSFSMPSVNRYIAGYKFCAHMVDSSIKVFIGYSQDASDPAQCNNAATGQINQYQVDIVFQVAGGCGVGALDAANSKGVYGIGVDADQSYLYPSVITSALKKVDVAVYDTINKFEKGQFSSKPSTFDLAHDGVGYAPVSSAVPVDATAKANAFAQQIIAGTLTPPVTIP